MQTPAPSDFETQTNATYDALMWALSRPGMARKLPVAGQASLIAALIDRECAIFSDDVHLMQIAAQAGAQIVAQNDADHLFLSATPDPSILSVLRQGTDIYPEDGATLVMPAVIGHGMALRLTGPGVDGAVSIKIDGIPDAFWTARRDVMRYPMGFDIFIIDQDQIIGIPRSTAIEVL
ncbi:MULTISPECIES: phosphonate C-P lyase system protein PhnH [Rhodobacterales]|uniref:phosphonate C-P lyase system protein PhnH n=1 Tax=Rhodobacterales TaxID=204455 RepID=UPI00215D963B|nr:MULTISPECIES: phosphonate C-P lyase system protein PhnH [Rhodobacterales]MDO6589944.1 phosphonate C-P lyase system protein PhnH [Yoonia sp. 1_MG-2023]